MAQVRLITVYSALPTNKIMRRPYLSLSGPKSKVPTAKKKKKPTKVRFTKDPGTLKYSLIVGSAGNYACYSLCIVIYGIGNGGVIVGYLIIVCISVYINLILVF